MDFVDCLFENQSVLIDIDDSTIGTLKYLSKKYELVILTNYFKEVQEKRLENAGLIKRISIDKDRKITESKGKGTTRIILVCSQTS